MINKFTNFVSWKKFRLYQFFKYFFFARFFLFEEENLSKKKDIYKTLSKLKPQVIKEDLIRLGLESKDGYLALSLMKKCNNLFLSGVSVRTGLDNDF